jgi:hypothetical protein
MVKTANARTTKAQQKTQPIVAYLRQKALLRAQLFWLSQVETVKAAKDADIKPIIDSYELNVRDNLNAWQAWREIYYLYYNKHQKVEKIAD